MALILIDPSAIAVYWRILCCVETGRGNPTTPICNQPWRWMARNRNLVKWLLRNIHRHHSRPVSHNLYILVVPQSAIWCFFCWVLFLFLYLSFVSNSASFLLSAVRMLVWSVWPESEAGRWFKSLHFLCSSSQSSVRSQAILLLLTLLHWLIQCGSD